MAPNFSPNYQARRIYCYFLVVALLNELAYVLKEDRHNLILQFDSRFYTFFRTNGWEHGEEELVTDLEAIRANFFVHIDALGLYTL